MLHACDMCADVQLKLSDDSPFALPLNTLVTLTS